MAHDATLTVRPAPWGADAERLLPAALAGASLADLRDQVEAGARLFHVCAGDAVVCAFVLRVDQVKDGSEGVIVAMAGALDGVDLVDTCLPVIEGLFCGVRRYRFHTARPGLARKMARHGYAAREIISYKDTQ